MARRNRESARYVYGVVRARTGGRAAGKGINGKPLRLVSSKGIAALTSEVPDEPLEAGREELLTHSRVLEKALKHGVVLPMRFGVVMPGEATIREELLDAHREDLEMQLEEMSGKVELNVKAIYDEAAVLREVVAERPEVARRRESLADQSDDATYYKRIELGELIAQALNEKRSADEQQVVDRLAPSSLAVEVGPPMHERMAVNASFLVADEGLEIFNKTLDEVAAENAERMRFKCTGPLPPHSFVELTVEA